MMSKLLDDNVRQIQEWHRIPEPAHLSQFNLRLRPEKGVASIDGCDFDRYIPLQKFNFCLYDSTYKHYILEDLYSKYEERSLIYHAYIPTILLSCEIWIHV